ncbi:MAG: iron-containing alcohol dehydrogenase family protein [Acutalibacteraceae bacterium]|nr:iron-containing alcohol dehydrogenase family protein [Acutalibacteraceae bacterium]
MSWYYKQPVEIIFGAGEMMSLPERISDSKNILIVTNSFFLDNENVNEIVRKLNAKVFTDVSENPDVAEVNRCSRFIRETESDVIVAIGGGSVIDLAKAASVMEENICIYHGTGKAIAANTKARLIAVPTTAGTGSEVTNVSVLSDRKTGKKCPIVSDSFYPDLAVIDPMLTITMPPFVTASTGIDVLCHAIEGYWSKGHQPVCDELAVCAAGKVFNWLKTAYEQPDSLEARVNMAEASLFAGLAFSLPKTTSSHACSFPLTSIYGIPHGEACGLTLDYFVRINSGDNRVIALAERLGFDSVQSLADCIFDLKKQLRLRIGLADLSLSDDQITELVIKSHHPNLLNNPIEITDEILYSIYNDLRKRA